MTFGERMKKIRKEKKLSQKKLGEIMGVTQQTIAQYEKAVDDPKFSTASKIALALGVSYGTLVGIDTFNTPEEFEKARTDYLNTLKQQEINRHEEVMERKHLEQYNKLSPSGKAFLNDIISVMLTFTPFIKDYDEDADLREVIENLKKDGYNNEKIRKELEEYGFSNEEIDKNFPIEKPIISEE